MKLNCIFVCFLAGLFGLINADVFDHLTFFNGRRMGGMVQVDPRGKQYCKVCKYTTRWFEQELDHFDPSNNRTWKQKYHTNDEFYDAQAGGPIFLMIGGESAIDHGWMRTGQWVNNAATHGALLLQLEHRYYGYSHPTDLSIENLKYLSSEQALADLESFIVAKNEEYNLGPDVKWIVFGGSYPGNLAAWVRVKYPDLVHGAISSSAPLQAKVDFQEYHAVVHDAIKAHSEECVTAIKDAVDATDALFQAADYEQLNNVFYMCEKLTETNANQKDIEVFYQSLAGEMAGIVQYNDETIYAGTSQIDDLCAVMLDEEYGTPIERLGALFPDCIGINYESMIEYLSSSKYHSSGTRQWIYQTCTEFGYFQTTNQSNMFTDQIPAEYFIDMCKDAFDASFDADFISRAVEATNADYGALDIDVDRIAFVQGTIDPWHPLGITETDDPIARPAIVIEGASHCADMQGERDDDMPQMIAARKQIADIISSWLEEA